MTELVLTFIVFGGLGLAMLFMNKLLGPRKKDPAKDRPFECGSPYLQVGIPPVSIPFVLVALIFLLFDVEIAFFFPWVGEEILPFPLSFRHRLLRHGVHVHRLRPL
jgi:NADH-quinone oxidoreductase subunit A